MGHPFKDTISLEEAQRISGPAAFNIMIKPAGSLCNLDCHYCYYLDKADIYGGHQPRMTADMLEKVVKEYIDANDVPQVQFNWHGGEPLVLGLDFYKKALEFEKKYAGGKTVYNTLQTNGTLITDEAAAFFAENNFLIGISVDGPADIHDKFRKDKGGTPTFDKVMRGIGMLHRHGVQFNTMTTINKASEGRGLVVLMKRCANVGNSFWRVWKRVAPRRSFIKQRNGLLKMMAKQAPWKESVSMNLQLAIAASHSYGDIWLRIAAY